ncbi:MAG: TlpA disulfide reductase family protein [Hydrogenovibrio sp.]
MIHAKNWMNPIKFSLLISMVWMALLSSTVQASTDIEFETLEGKTVKLSDFRGKWVVVNYWATWCPPCRVEMPELGFFYDAHKDKNAVVLGVNYEDSSPAKVKSFLAQEDIKFPIVRQKGGIDGKTTPFGPLRGLPTTYMVSPKGEVVAARTGMVDQKMLEEFIQKFDAKK